MAAGCSDRQEVGKGLMSCPSTAMRLVMLVLLLGGNPLDAAEPQAAESTLPREGVVINGRLYVGAGIANTDVPAYQRLAALWGAAGVPDFNEALYRERWKSVAMHQLASLYGPLPESFHLIYLDTNLAAKCGGILCAQEHPRGNGARTLSSGAELPS